MKHSFSFTAHLRPTVALALGALVASCTPSLPSGPTPPPALSAELDGPATDWVEETLAQLTLEQAVAQMVIPWIPGSYQSDSDPEFEQLLGWIDRGLGGVSISIGVPDAYVSKLNRLQDRAGVPRLVTSDFENGGPGMRINHAYALPSLLSQGGGTSFPPTMAFGAIDDEAQAFEYGRITAEEARAVGVHWLFAPVLDVNNNPENPIINTRSFGEDPERVGALGTAFMRGARSAGALTTAKHFPGHGDTRTDSHIEVPVVDVDRARLDAVELVPFQMAVDAGVDAVMTAHVAVPRVLGDSVPATLSPVFMTELLREDMGFDGLLFTDAMRMGAITEGYGGGEASVLSVEAGSDVVLAPADVDQTIDALIEAVESGRVTRERIDASVRRLLEAKARLGLHRTRTVDARWSARTVGSAANAAVARSVSEQAMTLVRDEAGVVPLGGSNGVLSVTYAGRSDLLAGRAFNATLRSYVPGVEAVRVGPDTPWSVFDSLLHAGGDSTVVVVGAYVSPRAGAGRTRLPLGFRTFVERFSSAYPDRFAFISFGNPYLLTAIPDVGSYMLAWGDREGPQAAAARALVGASPVSGRLPISIPPLHEIGDGLSRSAQPEMVAVDEGFIDPLQEAGFVPGARAGAAEEVSSGPTGGPGNWSAAPAPPNCDAVDGWDFCREGEAIRSLQEVDPARVGMDADALAELDQFILDAVADSAASGAALAILRRGQLVRLRGFGRHDWDSLAPPVTPASIFDLASLTKVVGTTSAAVVLAQRGAIDLDDRVTDYLPWWGEGDSRKRSVTLRHLLLHQGGLPPFRRFYLEMEGREAYEEAIGALELEYAPGEQTVYSDIGLMTIGFVVEAVSGMGLDEFLGREIWRPLGLADTGFNPDQSQWDRVVTTELDEGFRGFKVHGVAHDENAYAIGGVVGHAGLFSSARDLAVFAQMLLDRGTVSPCSPEDLSGLPCNAARFQPVTVFSPGWVDRVSKRQSESSSRAIGWDTPSERSSAGDYFSERAFGHTGYTGTSIWVDPSLDLAVVLLTNRVNPTRENTRHVPLRRGVHDRAAQAIVDRPVEPRNNR
ncbi:MAG: glycoside hydrolase family 3 N-terminal domain-containing protein [Longimicrobiales bacterium]